MQGRRCKGPKGPAFWTFARRFQLMELIEQGKSREEIANEMGVTVHAVLNARTKYGVPSHRATLLSASKAAELLGYTNCRTIISIIERGVLPARKADGVWLIHPDAFEAFLIDPRYWNLWNVETVQDPRLRARLTRLREDVDVVNSVQAADLKCCTKATIQRWVREGRLKPITVFPGQGRHGHLFRRADVIAFEPPPVGCLPGQNPRLSWKVRTA